MGAESQSREAAVFCLSLMGTDYPSFLEEAYRVLVPGGRLWIAEVHFVAGWLADCWIPQAGDLWTALPNKVLALRS